MLKSILRLSDYCMQTVAIRFIVESLLYIPNYKRFKYEAERNNLAKKIKVPILRIDFAENFCWQYIS